MEPDLMNFMRRCFLGPTIWRYVSSPLGTIRVEGFRSTIQAEIESCITLYLLGWPMISILVHHPIPVSQGLREGGPSYVGRLRSGGTNEICFCETLDLLSRMVECPPQLVDGRSRAIANYMRHPGTETATATRNLYMNQVIIYCERQ